MTPSSSPVPRRMARLMLSAGMLACFASAMMVRRRGFMSGSPPPCRAATVSSLIRRVNTLPRLASAAPFLCLMVCHLEWPDMSFLFLETRPRGPKFLARARPALAAPAGSRHGEARLVGNAQQIPGPPQHLQPAAVVAILGA